MDYHNRFLSVFCKVRYVLSCTSLKQQLLYYCRWYILHTPRSSFQSNWQRQSFKLWTCAERIKKQHTHPRHDGQSKKCTFQIMWKTSIDHESGIKASVCSIKTMKCHWTTSKGYIYTVYLFWRTTLKEILSGKMLILFLAESWWEGTASLVLSKCTKIQLAAPLDH